MKKNIGIVGLAIFALALLSVFIYSCKKTDLTTPNQQVSLFGAAGSVTSYLIPNDPTSTLKIGLGLTKVAEKDINITFSVSSPTGAVEGSQYTISSKTIKIAAGKIVDTVSLKGIFAGYPTGRRDTLVFKITGGDVPALIGSDVYTVILQKFCPLDMSAFSGNFKVLADGWQDYAIGDIIPLTVSADTVKFYYPTTYLQKPLLVRVDPNTFATSVALQTYGGYSTGGTVYSAKSVAGANSVVIPCDKIISVELSHSSAAGSYGNYIIRLQKQ